MDAHFNNGEVLTRWLADGRKMQLLVDVSFIDSSGKVWTAPHGTVIDGASIPRLLWSFYGSPFCGKYRKASVVHDFYCVARTEPHEAVHKMFYEACLASGVSEGKAGKMFWAVNEHGPKWDKSGNSIVDRWEEDDEGDFL